MTKNPFYLHVGKELLNSIERHMKTDCGFATLHSVLDRTLEDRMESFFLAETVKYLYVCLNILALKTFMNLVIIRRRESSSFF